MFYDWQDFKYGRGPLELEGDHLLTFLRTIFGENEMGFFCLISRVLISSYGKFFLSKLLFPYILH